MSLLTEHEFGGFGSKSESFKGSFTTLVERQFFRYTHPCDNHYTEVVSMRNEEQKEVGDDSGASDVNNCE